MPILWFQALPSFILTLACYKESNKFGQIVLCLPVKHAKIEIATWYALCAWLTSLSLNHFLCCLCNCGSLMLRTFGVREQNSIKVKAFDSIMNLSLSLGQLLVILIFTVLKVWHF